MPRRHPIIARMTQFPRDDRGATALEYGLILALIVIMMMGALSATGRATISLWYNVANTVERAR